MKPVRLQAPESSWLYALAGAAMTGGPVWRYLFVNRYPFGRPEAVVLPLVAMLLGVAIALIGHRAGGLIEWLSFSALLYIFVDLQFDLEKSIPTLVVVGACLALPQLIRTRRALITCFTLGAFDLASLPRPAMVSQLARAPTATRPKGSLPLLLHVVLDEQWGIGGFRAAGDSATADFLTDFYRQRGFEVYEAAYSRSDLTRESIAEVMSLGSRMVPAARVPETASYPAGFRLLVNPYFERLRELGFSIQVYQTTHLDHCHSAGILVESCETVPANSIANIGYLRGPWMGRAVLAGRYFLNLTSHTYVRLKRPPDSSVWRRSNAGRALAELGDVRDAIARRPGGGTAIFVHVLLPHRPFEVNADCRAYPDPGQRVGYETPKHLSDSVWHSILARYAAQDHCVHRALAELLAAVDSTVGRDGAIVIVHGDHGSRLQQNEPEGVAVSRLDQQQLNSLFSTLLAIRRPRVPASVRTEAVPVQDFLWELIGHQFLGEVSGEWVHVVRGGQPDSLHWPADSVRTLSAAEMLWVRPIR